MILHKETAGAYYGTIILNLQRKYLHYSKALVGKFNYQKYKRAQFLRREVIEVNVFKPQLPSTPVVNHTHPSVPIQLYLLVTHASLKRALVHAFIIAFIYIQFKLCFYFPRTFCPLMMSRKIYILYWKDTSHYHS